MPVIPSFSFGGHRAREPQSAPANPSFPDHIRSLSQSPLTSSNSNSPPGFVGPAAARGPPSGAEFREGAISISTSSSDASEVRRADSRGTSHSHFPASSTSSRTNLGDQHSITSGRTRHSHQRDPNSAVTGLLFPSTDVPILNGQEEEAALPGRRFMNMHRRARRERARSEIEHTLRETTDGRTQDIINDLDDDHIPLPTSNTVSLLPSRVAGGMTTGASLRRAQFATSSLIDGVESGQLARDTSRRVPFGLRVLGRSPAEAELGATDLVVRSGRSSSGRGSERAVAVASFIPPTIIPHTDITIVVAPPPVQLTTSYDALRRFAPNTFFSALPQQSLPGSTPTPAQNGLLSAASSSNLGSSTPSEPHGHAAGKADGYICATTTSTGWRAAHSVHSEGGATNPTLSEGSGSNFAANWQLSILATSSRGHVMNSTQDRFLSLQSTPNPSRCTESSASRWGCAGSAGSRLRSASRNLDLCAGLPRAASPRSSREVSWVQDDIAWNFNERGSAEQGDRFAAVPPLLGECEHSGLSQSASNGRRYSSAFFHGTRRSTSSSASVVSGISATNASLMVSASLSSFNVTVNTLPTLAAAPPHRQQVRSSRGDASSNHGPGTDHGGCGSDLDDILTARTSRSQHCSTGSVVSSSSQARANNTGHYRVQCVSRPSSPLQTPSLIPATVAEPSATPTESEFSSTQINNAIPKSAMLSHIKEATDNADFLQLPTAKDGVVLLNYTGNGSAQGELYRLLRVFHREPLLHFPQALRGPPLAVRLPDALNEDDGRDDDDSIEGWNDRTQEVAAYYRRHGGQHANRSGSSASNAALHASRSALSLEDSYEHLSRRRRHNRSPRSMQRGSSPWQHSSPIPLPSSASTSQLMATVGASNPRELLTRLITDPADRMVEVRGLSPMPSSAQSTSSHHPRRSCATGRSHTHHTRQQSTPASHADRGFGCLVGEGHRNDNQLSAHSFSSTPVRDRSEVIALNDRSLISTHSSSVTSSHANDSIAWQAELIANGFFNTDIRLRHTRNYEEAVNKADAEYGEGCYYTLPLTPLRPPSPPGQKRSTGGEVAQTADRDVLMGSSEEVMPLIPRSNGVCKTPSRILQHRHRFSARASSGAAPPIAWSLQTTNSHDGAASRGKLPPSLMPPTTSRVRPGMLPSRSSSLRCCELLSADNASRSESRACDGSTTANP